MDFSPFDKTEIEQYKAEVKSMVGQNRCLSRIRAENGGAERRSENRGG